MTTPLTPAEHIFLELAAIDEVHPHEQQVLRYITRQLDLAKVAYRQDSAGNIVATLPGGSGPAVALVGHVDIAAPLGGREVVMTADRIKTDGKGLLGADDKAAVAAMLELANQVGRGTIEPTRPVELIFTTGEEAGCVGATALDMPLVTSKQALVLDWTGPVNRIVTRSPAYVKIDVTYLGVAAHPAHWQDGKNAGAALIAAAAQLRVGEYAPEVTCNIGIFGFGKARNQVPGQASLQAELRSHDMPSLAHATADIRALFERTATEHHIEAKLSFVQDSPAYQLSQTGSLFAAVTRALASVHLRPQLEATFGGFDGNILADRGLDVVILGAGYYNPHSVDEYLARSEFQELLEFLRSFLQS